MGFGGWTTTVTSGADGSFTLDCPAYVYTVSCTAPPWQAPAPQEVHVKSGETTTVDFALQPDSTPPQVTLISPKDGSTVYSGYVPLEYEVDDDQASVYVQVDATQVNVRSGDPLDLSALPDGTHKVTVTGVDKAGNQSAVWATFTKQTTMAVTRRMMRASSTRATGPKEHGTGFSGGSQATLDDVGAVHIGFYGPAFRIYGARGPDIGIAEVGRRQSGRTWTPLPTLA